MIHDTPPSNSDEILALPKCRLKRVVPIKREGKIFATRDGDKIWWGFVSGKDGYTRCEMVMP